jgi:hypothetical protein
MRHAQALPLQQSDLTRLYAQGIVVPRSATVLCAEAKRIALFESAEDIAA